MPRQSAAPRRRPLECRAGHCGRDSSARAAVADRPRDDTGGPGTVQGTAVNPDEMHTAGIDHAQPGEHPAQDGAARRSHLELLAQDLVAGGEVDDGVPDALQRQDGGAGQVQAVRGLLRVDEVVDAVDAARRPGHEHGNGKHKRRPQVCELDGVHVAELGCDAVARGLDAGEHRGPRCAAPFRARCRRDDRSRREGLRLRRRAAPVGCRAGCRCLSLGGGRRGGWYRENGVWYVCIVAIGVAAGAQRSWQGPRLCKAVLVGAGVEICLGGPAAVASLEVKGKSRGAHPGMIAGWWGQGCV